MWQIGKSDAGFVHTWWAGKATGTAPLTVDGVSDQVAQAGLEKKRGVINPGGGDRPVGGSSWGFLRCDRNVARPWSRAAGDFPAKHLGPVGHGGPI